MSSEAVRLRAQLAQYLEYLFQLQAVESAEEVVRCRYLELLSSELAGLRDELVVAQQHLAVVRNGNELTLVIEAEETVYVILRQTAIMQRRAGKHVRASKQTHGRYLARHRWLVRHIDRLRRLVV